jgi:putative sterol carrier protein
VATLEELTDRVRRAVASGVTLERTVKLDLKGEGMIHIDGATVTISRKDLVAMGRRELDPTRAIMTGRLRLSDMGLALSLQPQIQALFGRAA